MLTLNQIRRTFEVIAEAHQQLRGFGFDNEANFGQSDDMEFPCLYVVQQPANIAGQTLSRTFDCFILDRYYGDADNTPSNITDVLSDTQLIAMDVVSLLSNTQYAFQLNKDTIQMLPIYGTQGDLLAGCKLTVTLEEAFDYWRCSVPYDFIVIEEVNGTQVTSTNEKDPTVPTFVKAITEANIAYWNAAYPSGNPSGFVTSGAVQGFYPSSNPSGFITSSFQGFYPSGNPSGFLTNETDPTVPAVVKAMPVSGSAAPIGWNGSAYVLLPRSGTWAGRPTASFVGQMFFATDLGTNGTLLTWDGVAWRGRVVYKSSVSVGTGSTTANTIVRSVAIPAGLMQANSVIHIDGYFNAAATQVFSTRVYIESSASGTTNLVSQALNQAANVRQVATQKVIFNRNATNSQQSYFSNNAVVVQQNASSINESATQFTVDTSAAFFINFAIQKGDGQNIIVLAYSSVTIEI
jgi:hypothetical protein